ncbi:MAG TPA: sialidase family protein [Arenimonas sp.]|nr:sialidase family protein [Arenimonas sp.]
MKILLAGMLLLPLSVAAADVRDWPLPAPDGAAQPQLSTTPQGELLLSWIERVEAGGHRLRFARFDTQSRWGAARTAAQGSNWFVNWADVPAMQALPDGSLWAHTLEKSAPSTYAYDVVLRRSEDGGARWSAPHIVHDDGSATEHGFVALWPAGKNRLGIAWLDGRETAGGAGHDAHGHGEGRMTLRAASFDAALGKHDEALLDASTCDCCQTAAATLADGVLLAYRGRTAGEVRDIFVTRYDGKAWSAPKAVHDDGWVMPACPVNGPSVATRGNQAWVAWPTGAGGASSLRLAHSRDGGASFAPMQVVAGDESLGRVALAADAETVWVLWMQEAAGQQTLWLARYPHALGKPLWRQQVAVVQGRGRGTGFPRLALREGRAQVVWTEIVAGQPRLRGLQFTP